MARRTARELAEEASSWCESFENYRARMLESAAAEAEAALRELKDMTEDLERRRKIPNVKPWILRENERKIVTRSNNFHKKLAEYLYLEEGL